MFKYLKDFWARITDRSNDPVYSCDVHKSKEGCSHVDGFLCDMATCDILKKHKISIMTPQQKVEFLRKLDDQLSSVDKMVNRNRNSNG
jgi:hypothetical protein